MIEPFRVLAADPPWPFKDKLPGKTRGAARRYNTLSVDDICNLEMQPIADDALLFLWRVSSMVEEAYRVCRAWGFVPKSELVWVKTSSPFVTPPPGFFPRTSMHFGMGRYVRASHETCIIARRGRAAVKNKSIRSVFHAPVGPHSAKPDEFYRLVEELSDGPYLELFARQRRHRWVCLGNELGHTLQPVDQADAP